METAARKPTTVEEWQAQQTDMIVCKQLGNLKMKREQCLRRQENLRHTDSNGHVKAAFQVCKDCELNLFHKRAATDETQERYGRTNILTPTGIERTKADHARRRHNFEVMKEREKSEKLNFLTQV